MKKPPRAATHWGGIKKAVHRMIHPMPKPPTSNTGAAPPLIHSERRFETEAAEVGIDHLRLSGRAETASEALELFTRIFPQSEPLGRGNQFYRDQIHDDHTDSSLFTDQYVVDGGWMIEVTGQGCAWLGRASHLLQAFRPLIQNPQVNCSRLDIFVDLFGPVRDMIRSLTESLQNGLLTPMASFTPHDGYSHDGTRNRHGLSVGSRASRRYLRVYDKGLETKTRPQGEWIRWEAEFKAEATKPVLAIMAANPSDQTLQDLARGVIGSLEGSGKSYANMVSTTPSRPPMDRKETTMVGMLEGYKNRMATIYEVHRISDIPVAEICDRLGLFDPPETPPAKDSRRIRRAHMILEHIIGLSDTMTSE